jgi:hypothetical protein
MLVSAATPPVPLSLSTRQFGEAATWAAVTVAVTRKLSASEWQMAMICHRSRPRCARQPHAPPLSQRAVFHSTRCWYACHGCVGPKSPARASLLLRILTRVNATTRAMLSTDVNGKLCAQDELMCSTGAIRCQLARCSPEGEHRLASPHIERVCSRLQPRSTQLLHTQCQQHLSRAVAIAGQ